MTPRILLADDSPHARRIGARILMEEGFEVEEASDGSQVYPSLDYFDPDVVIADVFLPNRSGYEICHWIKTNPRHQGMKVVLTAGLLEALDEEQAIAVGCDAVIRKPFEASEVVAKIAPLAAAARHARGLFGEAAGLVGVAPKAPQRTTPRPDLDPEKIREAVRLALEASMPKMIEEVSERVLIALGH